MTEVILVNWNGVEKEIKSIIFEHCKDRIYIDLRNVAKYAIAKSDLYPNIATDVYSGGRISDKGIRGRIAMLAKMKRWKPFNRHVVYNPIL